MNFRTNFSKLTLLGNQLTKIYFDDKIVEFIAPSIKLYLTDYEFIEVMGLLRLEPDAFNKLFSSNKVKVNTRYGILKILLSIDERKEEILNIIKLIFPNIDFEKGFLTVNKNPINEEEYNLMLDFLFTSCMEKDIEPFLKKIENQDIKVNEIEKRMREAEEKVNQYKKKSSTNKGSTITIDQIVIAILYEFPGLSLSDIYNMNMYTLLSFWSYVAKVVDTQIQVVAAGNGLAKEFTYFIN